jgi:hypothetical protein
VRQGGVSVYVKIVDLISLIIIIIIIIITTIIIIIRNTFINALDAESWKPVSSLLLAFKERFFSV